MTRWTRTWKRRNAPLFVPWPKHCSDVEILEWLTLQHFAFCKIYVSFVNLPGVHDHVDFWPWLMVSVRIGRSRSPPLGSRLQALATGAPRDDPAFPTPAAYVERHTHVIRAPRGEKNPLASPTGVWVEIRESPGRQG